MHFGFMSVILLHSDHSCGQNMSAQYTTWKFAVKTV